VIVVGPPTATLVARPPATIVAMPVLLEVQVTVEVPGPVLLSEYVMVAWNCCLVPSAIDGLGGVTATAAADTQAPVVVLQCGLFVGHWVSSVQKRPASASGGGIGSFVTSGGGWVTSGGGTEASASGGSASRVSGGGWDASASGGRGASASGTVIGGSTRGSVDGSVVVSGGVVSVRTSVSLLASDGTVSVLRSVAASGCGSVLSSPPQPDITATMSAISQTQPSLTRAIFISSLADSIGELRVPDLEKKVNLLSFDRSHLYSDVARSLWSTHPQ
jgi:hypothetical protein